MQATLSDVMHSLQWNLCGDAGHVYRRCYDEFLDEGPNFSIKVDLELAGVFGGEFMLVNLYFMQQSGGS